jgi:predicted ATPase/class 3 adenylate cyclase
MERMTDELQPTLPTGTITFLFTDIEGSTPLWEREPAAMEAAVACHHAILHAAAKAHHGHVFKIVGDEFQISFENPDQALGAALAAQRALRDEAWGETGPLTVRMGLHTGPGELGDGVRNTADYAVSHTLNRVARIRSAGHGGQVLLSLATAELLAGQLPQDTTLRDLGEHTLKGLARPEHIFQLVTPDLAADFPPLVSESRLRHNLPVQPTAFVGRERELAQLGDLIASPETRLITIVGPGGIGKTRLALAVAQRQLRTERQLHAERQLAAKGLVGDIRPADGASDVSSDAMLFSNGVFFVALAVLSEVEQIAPSVAEALGFRFGGGEEESRTPQQQLLDYLREKHLLLVMDNFEHLLGSLPEGRIEVGTELLAGILRTAPEVQILVTSRERLHLHEEQVYPIQGLQFPDWERPEDTAEYTAAQLFLQSARRVQPGFELAGDDLTYLARVCRLLEGMPLGLELAAGWVDTLTLVDIAIEIQRGLDFLETEWRDVPARHRSMRAVFDVSWRRLNAAEQETFAQLCVFRGGFTRAAGQEVAGAGLRTLARLVDKSLLQFNRTQGRYGIHALLRQYGADRLAQEPETEAAARDRHSAFFCSALAGWEGDIKGPRQVTALAEIDADLENVRAAWAWAADHVQIARLGQALEGYALFHNHRARHQEADNEFALAQERLTAAISRDATRTEDVPSLQRTLANLTLWRCEFNHFYNPGHLGHWELANSLLEQSQAVLDSPALADQDTRRERAFLCRHMAYAAAPNWQQALRHLQESLSLSRAVGDQWNAAWSAVYMGDVYQALDDLEPARELLEEGLAVCRVLGCPGAVSEVLLYLGLWARAQCDYEQAKRYFEESLALARA